MNKAINTLIAKKRGTGSIYLLFFLSGITGLVYEVLWTRMFALVFGATALAISTVLAAFMGGLALGSFYFGRLIDKRGEPLKIYAILEILIGIYALILPLIIMGLNAIYTSIYQNFSTSFFTLSVIRFILSFIVLIIPATLMGGTLPILSKAVVSKRESLGLNIGSLYSINTIGGATGCFLAGFVFIALIGIRNTTYVAVGSNLAIGLAAWILSMRGFGRRQPEAEVESQAQPTDDSMSRKERLIILAFGLSGFAALSYEVLWTRVLDMILGTTVYAFSIMLTSFLCGLALGSFVMSRFIDKRRNLTPIFGGLQIVIGCFGLFTILIFGKLPVIFLKLFGALGSSWRDFTFIQFIIAFIVMLVPTFLMGATFPVVSRICTRQMKFLGRSIGNIYSANTIGAILGSLLSGFLLIPLIGIQNSIKLIASINVIIGMIALVGSMTKQADKSRKLALSTLVIGSLVFLSLIIFPSWDKRVLSSGVYFEPWLYRNQNQEIDLEAKTNESKMLYYAEGIDSTASIFSRGPEITFKINGMPLASNLRTDLTLLGIMGHLPALLHGSPESVLVIGLGAGVTSGMSAQHESVKRVDCAELERKVIGATRFFDRENRYVLDNPKFNLIIDDGRNYLQKTDVKYDVITSDPVHPWLSGAGSLYSVEHFQSCKEHLNEGGVAAQWLPLYQMAEKDFKTVIRTFQSVFPHATLWLTDSDAILIGTADKLNINYMMLERKFREEKIEEDMRMMYVDSIYQFLTFFMMDEKTLSKFAADAKLNTDDYPVLEFSAPAGLYSKTVGSNLELIRQNIKPIAPFLYNLGDETEASEMTQNLTRYFEEKKDILRDQIADISVGGE